MSDPLHTRTTLEWPPPGTSGIHSRLWRLRTRALLSTALIATALCWFIFPTPDSRAMRGIMLWVAVVGIFLFFRVVLAIAGFLDLARRAQRLGYSRATLLHVMLDRKSDTAPLLSGTGQYEMVRERARNRVLRLRTLSAAFHVAAAMLPLPLLCVALMLAFRHEADPVAFALIPIGPFIFFTITAAVVDAYAAILVHWDRGSDAWDPSPVSDAQRAVAWQHRAIAVAAGDIDDDSTHADASDRDTVPAPPVARPPGILFALAVTGIAVITFIVTVAVLAAAFGYGAVSQVRQSFREFTPDFVDASEAESVRYLRVGADSSVTARMAGDALHVLLYPTGQVTHGMREPRQRYATALWPGNVPWLPSGNYYWRYIVERDSSNGLRGAALHALDSLVRRPPHPALPLIHVLAVAPRIDVAGARYSDDAAPSDIGRNLFVSHDLAVAATVEAASTLARGDARGAETRLREMISAGILLMDESPFRTDFDTGAELVSAGREGLVYLYSRTGRADAAAALRSVGSSSMMMRRLNAFYMRTSSPEQTWRLSQPGPRYASVRWSAFQAALPMARCESLASVMFGLSPRNEAQLARTSSTIAHSASDSLLLRAVIGDTLYPRPLPRRAGFRRLVRAARFLLTDQLADSPCLGAVTARF
jgi:hypothetical protein